MFKRRYLTSSSIFFTRHDDCRPTPRCHPTMWFAAAPPMCRPIAQYMGTSGTETERIAAETEKRVAATYEATKSRKEEVVSMLISFVTNVDTTVRTSGKN